MCQCCLAEKYLKEKEIRRIIGYQLRTGKKIRKQKAGTAFTDDKSILSYVPSSLIPVLCIPNYNSNSFPARLSRTVLSPLLSFPSLNGMTLSPYFLWKLGMTGLSVRKSFQSHTSFYPYHSWGPRLSQWGLGQGTHESGLSLSNQGGPIKSSQGGKSYKQKENLKPVSSSIYYSPIVEFPFLC